MNAQQMNAMNAVIGTGNVDAIAAVWKAFAPILPRPRGARPSRNASPPSRRPRWWSRASPSSARWASSRTPASRPTSGAPADLGRERPSMGSTTRTRKPAARAGGKAKKQKAHNQPPEYKPPTKKALKEAKPPAKLKAFQAYMIVQTAKLAKQGVAFETPGERMKELAARWKALSDAEKERYKSKALKLDEERHAEWMAKQ